MACAALMLSWCVGVSFAYAKRTKPVISNLAAAPGSVPSGGRTTVTASVTGANECTLSANKSVAGLPVTFSCESGAVNRSLSMPTNTGKKAVKYRLALDAESGSGGKAKAKITVDVQTGGQSSGVRQVVADEGDSCALLTSGHVDCWGWNGLGQLGDGTDSGPEQCEFEEGEEPEPCSKTPVEVAAITDATQIAANSQSLCALLSTGHVECWGGLRLPAEPTEVEGVADAVEVAGGDDHACARLATGKVDCWGENLFGELGNGSKSETGALGPPVEAHGIGNATRLATGGDSCAVLSTHHVNCWGINQFGQLGDGTDSGPETCGAFSCSLVPAEVSSIDSATDVTSSYYYSTCATLSNGHVDCWGINRFGTLGKGTASGPEACGGYSCATTPAEVSGLGNAVEVSAGYIATCALLSTGNIDCWGSGELGNGTVSESEAPVQVSSIDDATQVSTGFRHACAVLTTGHVDCWGGNAIGQLGDGNTTSQATPVEVAGL